MPKQLTAAQFIRRHIVRELASKLAREKWTLCRIDSDGAEECETFALFSNLPAEAAAHVWRYLETYDASYVRLTFERPLGITTMQAWVDLHLLSEPETLIGDWLAAIDGESAVACKVRTKFAAIVDSIGLY